MSMIVLKKGEIERKGKLYYHCIDCGFKIETIDKEKLIYLFKNLYYVSSSAIVLR